MRTPTYQQVVALVGNIDGAAILSILKTRASDVEIETAARLAAGETAAAAERHLLSGLASAVYDILVMEPTFNSTDDDR